MSQEPESDKKFALWRDEDGLVVNVLRSLLSRAQLPLDGLKDEVEEMLGQTKLALEVLIGPTEVAQKLWVLGPRHQALRNPVGSVSHQTAEFTQQTEQLRWKIIGRVRPLRYGGNCVDHVVLQPAAKLLGAILPGRSQLPEDGQQRWRHLKRPIVITSARIRHLVRKGRLAFKDTGAN